MKDAMILEFLVTTGKKESPMDVLLYDGSCSWCTGLAQWSARRMGGRLKLLSYQDYCRQERGQQLEGLCWDGGSSPEKLAVIRGGHHEKEDFHGPLEVQHGFQNSFQKGAHEGPQGQVLVGKDAWEWILMHHPSLQEIAWVAQKLGLEKRVAQQFERGGHFVRRLCRMCR